MQDLPLKVIVGCSVMNSMDTRIGLGKRMTRQLVQGEEREIQIN